MASYPPDPAALASFPEATLTHHVGLSAFPLSTGPCALVQLDGGQLALTIDRTTVVLGKENRVRKTDPNQTHASYSFNFSPTPSAPVASSSTSTDLPTSNAQGGGSLKLTLPESKNSEEYDRTTLLARQFEGELMTAGLLDTRSQAEIDEDASETLTATLSSFYTSTLAGVRQTAGSVYAGARELAEEVGKERETKGLWGALKERAGSLSGGTPLSELRGEGKGKSREEFTEVSLNSDKPSNTITAAELASAGKTSHATAEEAV